MYFPILESMREFEIDPAHIRVLDTWLGTRRAAVRNHLDPYSFSVDSGLDEEFALRLFSIACNKTVNVLKPVYILHCPTCERRHDVSNLASTVIECFECEEDLDTAAMKESVEIWFQLLLSPKSDQPTNDLALKYMQGLDPFPKLSGLTLSRVETSEDPYIHELFSMWGRRI